MKSLSSAKATGEKEPRRKIERLHLKCAKGRWQQTSSSVFQVYYMNGIPERKKNCIKRQQQQNKITYRPIKTFLGNNSLKTFKIFFLATIWTYLGENQPWECSWDWAQIIRRLCNSLILHISPPGWEVAWFKTWSATQGHSQWGHSLPSLTIQVEIKDPRILFKIAQRIT